MMVGGIRLNETTIQENFHHVLIQTDSMDVGKIKWHVVASKNQPTSRIKQLAPLNYQNIILLSKPYQYLEKNITWGTSRRRLVSWKSFLEMAASRLRSPRGSTLQNALSKEIFASGVHSFCMGRMFDSSGGPFTMPSKANVLRGVHDESSPP